MEKQPEHKKGDIVTVYGNPLKQTYPIGEAKLVNPLTSTEILEQWEVEYLNNPNIIYNVLIKK